MRNYPLRHIRNMLNNLWDFQTWLRTITSALKHVDLDRLIDLNLRRPKRDSPNADRWYRSSHLVKNWMAEIISVDLQRRINAQTEKELRFADEFLAPMMKIFKKHSTSSTLECDDQWFKAMKRESYDSDLSFVQGAMNAYYQVREMKIFIPEWVQICRILNQFDRSCAMMVRVMAEMEMIVKENKKHIHEQFFMENYQRVMSLIQNYVRWNTETPLTLFGRT